MRHFWIKRQDIISQAEKWLSNASLNASRAGSNSDIEFETAMVPTTVRYLAFIRFI